MRHLTLAVPLLLMACASTPANTPEPMSSTPPEASATAPTEAVKEVVKITPVHHSAMEMEWSGHVLYVDPHDGADRFKGFGKPELVLITDIHPDHMDPATLHGLDLSKARIIAPKAVMDQLPDDLKKITTVLANGAKLDVGDIQVEAVPMYNMPDPNDPRHPKGRGNGYVLTMGGERIYISGDTEDIPEMRALKNIDVAFVCMNLPYTMTVEQAAAGVLAFKPRIVYPYHYRGKDGMSDVGKFKELVNAGDQAIDVRLVDWYK